MPGARAPRRSRVPGLQSELYPAAEVMGLTLDGWTVTALVSWVLLNGWLYLEVSGSIGRALTARQSGVKKWEAGVQVGPHRALCVAHVTSGWGQLWIGGAVLSALLAVGVGLGASFGWFVLVILLGVFLPAINLWLYTEKGDPIGQARVQARSGRVELTTTDGLIRTVKEGQAAWVGVLGSWVWDNVPYAGRKRKAPAARIYFFDKTGGVVARWTGPFFDADEVSDALVFAFPTLDVFVDHLGRPAVPDPDDEESQIGYLKNTYRVQVLTGKRSDGGEEAAAAQNQEEAS